MYDEEECYYELYIDEKSLDTKNNEYEWRIMFYSLASVVTTLSSGPILEEIDERIVNISEGQDF